MYKCTYKIVLFIAVLSSVLFTNDKLVEGEKVITDFYEYVNGEWLDSTNISGMTVVNNWGILWDKIINKSTEILSSEVEYNLDDNHQYLLKQLQNFYNSSREYSNDNKKRVELIQNHYPTLFGIIFSKVTISQTKEDLLNNMIDYLLNAYRHEINKSSKIGGHYKKLYLAKLDKMEFKIGSPELSDFPLMPILSNDSLEYNIGVSEEYKQKKYILKKDWKFPPYETECRYSILDNKVYIYAGILFDPYYYDEKNFVYLFATIGRTISHEMMHAFDNVGKNYDEKGNHISWIKKLFTGGTFSKNNLENIYDSLIDQYSQYTIQDSLFVDGEITLQENIADMGGIEVSLLAIKKYLKDNQSILTEEEFKEAIKNYFITYAQFWREKAAPEFEISSLKRIHTPQKYRAIGPIYNQDDFYEAFEIDSNSKFFIPPNLRVKIW